MLTRLRNLEFNLPAMRGTMRQLLFPDGHWTRIRWGPLRGMRILNRPDVNLHLLFGAWELRNFAVLSKVFDAVDAKGWTGAVLDLGANMGAYSYWLERTLPDLEVIYAFEPSPGTAQRLREQLGASNAAKVQVVQAACVETNRPVEFFLSHHHHSSSVVQSFAHAEVLPGNRTSLMVQGIAVDDFMSVAPSRVHFVKIDIEGGAVFALQGIIKTIGKFRPLVLIESHTPDEDHAISQMLLANQYEALRLNTGSWVIHKDADHRNKDGVWGTMICVPSENLDRLEPVLGAAS